jgi:hypothetical protein
LKIFLQLFGLHKLKAISLKIIFQEALIIIQLKILSEIFLKYKVRIKKTPIIVMILPLPIHNLTQVKHKVGIITATIIMVVVA